MSSRSRHGKENVYVCVCVFVCVCGLVVVVVLFVFIVCFVLLFSCFTSFLIVHLFQSFSTCYNLWLSSLKVCEIHFILFMCDYVKLLSIDLSTVITTTAPFLPLIHMKMFVLAQLWALHHEMLTLDKLHWLFVLYKAKRVSFNDS